MKAEITFGMKKAYNFSINNGVITTTDFPFKNIMSVKAVGKLEVYVTIFAELIPIENSYDFKIIEL